MTDAPTPTAQELAGTVPVESAEHFAQLVMAWHAHQIAQLRHALTVPEGTTFEIGDGDDVKDLVLEGPALAGFKFGIELAIMRLGTLPFAVELEPDAPQPDA